MLAVRDIRAAGRFGILVLGLWVTGTASSVSAQDNLTIPEVPANFNFVQDYASLLPPQVKTEIGAIQKQSFEQNQKPIIVVTIDSMARYGATGYSIERFAAAIPHTAEEAPDLKVMLKAGFGFGDVNACLAFRKWDP